MHKLSPIKIFLVYWVFSLVLYAFGPFAWVTYKPLLFWSLNILFLLAFCLGWRLSDRVSFGGGAAWTDQDTASLIRRLGPMLCINLIFEVLNLFRIFAFSSFDFVGLIKRVIYGISNMGDSYNSFQESINVSSAGVVGGKLVSLFNYVWDIWGYSTLLFGVLLFKKLKAHFKVVAAATVLLEVVAYLSRGTNIGVFRVILIFLVFYYIKHVKTSTAIIAVHKRRKTKLIFLAVAAAVIVIGLFDKIMKSRGGISYWQMGFYNIGGIHINPNSVFFKILPSGFHQLLVSLSGYLSQGYYGMSLSMRVPFKPMWGIGYSMAIQNVLKQFLPTIANASYQVRIEQFGWDSYTQWHTMYSWFANDVTYYGVIAVMLLFGFIFHKAYNDSLKLNNPFAKAMLYYFFLMAIFLPCNNQIGQTTYMLFSFFYVFIKWQLSKRKMCLRI